MTFSEEFLTVLSLFARARDFSRLLPDHPVIEAMRLRLWQLLNIDTQDRLTNSGDGELVTWPDGSSLYFDWDNGTIEDVSTGDLWDALNDWDNDKEEWVPWIPRVT